MKEVRKGRAVDDSKVAVSQNIILIIKTSCMLSSLKKTRIPFSVRNYEISAFYCLANYMDYLIFAA